MNKLFTRLKLILYKFSPTDEDYVKARYRNIFGKEANLLNPETFNEKIIWTMLNYRNPLYELCSDKLNVRKYITLKGLGGHLTDLYQQYDSVDDIDFEQLPNQFVIKTTHASGGVCVIPNKNLIDKSTVIQILKESMSKNLYKSSREWQYKNIKPRIMAEELIKSPSGEPLKDYKFYCFNGTPRFIHVSSGIGSGDLYEMDFYDTDWNLLEAQREGRLKSKGIKKPHHFDEMMTIAKTLSQDFPHVRVDLFSSGKKIYIGELTFTTAAGGGRFTDDKWDYEFGKYFTLPDEYLRRSNVLVD